MEYHDSICLRTFDFEKTNLSKTVTFNLTKNVNQSLKHKMLITRFYLQAKIVAVTMI